MAKSKKNTGDILIQTVNVRPINRQNPDIGKWRSALKAAESGSYSRQQLYDIYEEVLLDGHLKSVIEKRINAISNIELKFFNTDKTENEEISMLVNTTWFEKTIREIVNARFWGLTLLEFSRENDTFRVSSIDRRHVKPEFGIVAQNPSDTSGMSYIDVPNALFAGNADFGLLLQACPYVIYKRGNVADWAEFNEIFGKPYPQGSYENGETADILTDAFEKAGFDAYMIAPKDAEITLHQASTGTTGASSFESFKNAMNEELSVLILGQTLTTKVGDSGSFAAGKVHSEVEESIFNADKEFVVKTLNEKLIPVLQNFGVKAQGEFRFIYADEIPLSERIVIDEKLNAIVPIDENYFFETYNIPKGTAKTAKSPEKNKSFTFETKDEDENAVLKLFHSLFSKKKKVLPFS